MNAILRVSVCASALTVAFGGLEFSNPGWIMELGPASAEFYDQRARLDHERKLARQLVEEDTRILARSAHKQRVLDDLLAGRMTLWQAAARFRDLQPTLSFRDQSLLASLYPANSDEERFCRQVIAHLEVEKRPPKDVALIERLTNQLEEALSCGRTPYLPD